MLPLRNVWCLVMFWGWLCVPLSCHIFIYLSFGSRTNQLTCSLHHFNCAPLDRADRKTQTRGTQAYSPLICNLRRTIAADIALPKDAVIIEVIRVEVAMRFRCAKMAIYQSSAGVVTLGWPATGFRTTACVVWNSFHKCEMTEWWTPKKRATSVIDCPAPMRPTACQRSNLPFVSWKSYKHVCLKNKLYSFKHLVQHLQ